MLIEPVGATGFSVQLTDYEVVGFHATSQLAAEEIEKVGFLPHKILDAETHVRLVAAAKDLGIPVDGMGGYAQWLGMRSVTFTRDQSDALSHASSGNAGGQGLRHIEAILAKLRAAPGHQQLAESVQEHVARIRTAPAVVYAVDLSGLGSRLDEAHEFGVTYYRVHWDLSAPLPTSSEVGPDRLIARLNL